MLRICRTVEKVAPTNVTCTLLGESGTGKEVFARAIHNLSPRSEKRFVAINCAAVPENLMESELFGYEKGAFTGAVKRTLGKVETAHEGSIVSRRNRRYAAGAASQAIAIPARARDRARRRARRNCRRRARHLRHQQKSGSDGRRTIRFAKICTIAFVKW